MCRASERVHLKNQDHNLNRAFAQWCLFTTKTRINFVSSFSYALRFSFSLMYSNTQLRTKHSLNLGLRH